ncbi:MAG TPA: Eco57I restriction-modification methylase domain-containing protein [Rhizomicrobium sp.]|nr:Eco57I restriction-modification methylase domain-containing protein [Rhizomicrobium sp.]
MTVLPPSATNERPTEYAERLGRAYAEALPPEQRKAQGLYLTPSAVARFMAAQLQMRGEHLRLLDPAAGSGVLIAAAIEALALRKLRPTSIEVVAYEIDHGLLPHLRAVLSFAEAWARDHGLSVSTRVKCGDFVLEHASALQALGGFLPAFAEPFDAVIANPPYFKIAKDDPRARAALSVVHGQPNIYGLFMAVTAALLKPNGAFVYITPRSFASGPYFRLFRERFFDLIQPKTVHVFNSRRDAFSRDDVLQENIIFVGERSDHWHRKPSDVSVTISTSHGTRDLDQPEIQKMPLSSLLDMDSADKVLRIPASENDASVLSLVDGWPRLLSHFGMGISTGPVVPFRAREHLEEAGDILVDHAPMLWMNHVQPMSTHWPNGARRPQYIKLTALERGLLVPNKNYVLLRRFSAKEEKRRLTAAPYLANQYATPFVGLENHLNYIHRPGGSLTEPEAWGLAALYSSRLLDTYFRAINGNTQVSATELRIMPLPEYTVIEDIGRRACGIDDPDVLDELVMDAIAQPNRKRVKAVAHA